jgi:hypothetical protein
MQYEDVFHGYAGVLKGPILDFVRRSSDVEYVQASVAHIIATLISPTDTYFIQ